jgi:predicted nucleic acid-binding protein
VDRVFLDANVLFSAAWREAAGLLVLWDLPHALLVTSRYAVDEALANLPEGARRDRLRRLLERLVVGETSFDEVPVPAGVSVPDADVPILRAAIAMRATHLLTGDLRHFGPLMGTQVAGVEILRPADYVRRRAAGGRGER